jgi:hypothetical protein
MKNYEKFLGLGQKLQSSASVVGTGFKARLVNTKISIMNNSNSI